MQKELSARVLELLDKKWMMYEMTKCLNLNLTLEQLNQYLSDSPISLTASTFKQLYKIEQCVDKGLILALSNHVNYLAFAEGIYKVFVSNGFIRVNSEIASALMNTLEIVLQEKVDDRLICNLYNATASVNTFENYKYAIAILVTNVFSMREAYGKVTLVNGVPVVTCKLEN